MKNIIILLLLISSSIYSKDKFYIGGNFSPNIIHFVGGASLDYIKDSTQFKLETGGDGTCLACDCMDPQDSFIFLNTLIGYRISNKYTSLSVLGGVGIFKHVHYIKLLDSDSDSDSDKTSRWNSKKEITISIPLEIEFGVNLNYIELGFSLYTQINNVNTIYGMAINIKFLLNP